MKQLLSRLLPAANLAAVVAALFHVLGVGVAAGSIGLESLAIAILTYLIAFVVAVPAGFALLAVVAAFGMGLVSSMLVFLTAAQLLTAALISTLFESELSDFPVQYALVSVPATIAAWYNSVYRVRTSGQTP